MSLMFDKTAGKEFRCVQQYGSVGSRHGDVGEIIERTYG